MKNSLVIVVLFLFMSCGDGSEHYTPDNASILSFAKSEYTLLKANLREPADKSY